MDFNKYVNLMEQRFEKNFDVEKNKKVLNQDIDLFAKMEFFTEKYFGMKDMKVWRTENYEYVLLKKIDELTNQNILDYQDYLISSVKELVKPHSEHMSTVITGVIVTEGFNNITEKYIKKFRYRKMYAFSFKGWVEIRLLVLDINSNSVISNAKGKKIQKFYLPIIER